jgi:hypothetical protein
MSNRIALRKHKARHSRDRISIEVAIVKSACNKCMSWRGHIAMTACIFYSGEALRAVSCHVEARMAASAHGRWGVRK